MTDRRFQAACAAMTGILANEGPGQPAHRLAECAFFHADALLAAMPPEAESEAEPHKCSQDCIAELEELVTQAEECGNRLSSHLFNARKEIKKLTNELAEVRRQHEQTVKERDDLAKRVRELEAAGDIGSVYLVDFMKESLFAIAGAVCTPEKGYLVDGGFRQLLRDIKELRKQRDVLLEAAKFILTATGSIDLEATNMVSLAANIHKWRSLKTAVRSADSAALSTSEASDG